ncbi:DDB1- and CUL4-associated factor 5 [Exaiptasia diaphana]|uniref:DDB1- and CUL4-associated factor 5 n=1 Tax=Exaiptasia diaphana TaxID=2652724 RepID=A0A913WUJ0_EXADI|nr:DDB1- and CUL4-associated factor 5 [Exaiptasia diaphana]KXJ17739.1 DDB1- and CUL4-associated factor 5 [Exaiptasia diaphana]
MSRISSSLGKRKQLPCFQNTIQQNGHSSLLKSYMSARFEASHDLYRTDLRGHYGCVNAIEFSNQGGEFVVSGGDDRRVLLWNIDKTLYRKAEPVVMKGHHRSNIFCTVFDAGNRHLFSAGNDDRAMRHDILTRETLGFYFHDHPVYGLNVHPDQENIFLTACDNGKVLLWDARNASQSASQCIADYHRSIAFHAAVFNPVDPVLIATANSSKGVQLWDVRFPKRVLKEFSSTVPKVCAMGVKWNATGTLLSALCRRLPPVLYSIEQSSALVEFKHPGYNNICTMKSHCFAGDKDQYIISGSDDFNVYLWKVPTLPSRNEKLVTVDRAKMVLSGHRSIVNQVRFNPATHMVISAGVEKIIKVWSPWYLPGAKGDLHKKEQMTESRRELYSHDDYVDLVLDSGRPLTHEYEGGSVDEDPRMLAFFDTLIQREQGGWNSDSDSNLSEDDFYSNFLVQSTEASDSDSGRLSSQRVRDILEQETRDSDDSDETSQAVLRRMRRLRRAAFLRGLVRGSERQDEEEGEQHPADAQSVFIQHLTREIMREALESSSDSSDSEPTVTLAFPEELAESDNSENTITERVEFHRSRTRQGRQYRRRDSSPDNSPNTSISNENDINFTERRLRREASSSSSSEEDSHEDECRISQLHENKLIRRTLDDSERMNTATTNATSDGPSTSCYSGNSVVQENSASERCCFDTNDDHVNNGHVDNCESVMQHADPGEHRTDVQDMHPDNSVNHNGHRFDAHNSQAIKTHHTAEEQEHPSDSKHEDLFTQ